MAAIPDYIVVGIFVSVIIGIALIAPQLNMNEKQRTVIATLRSEIDTLNLIVKQKERDLMKKEEEEDQLLALRDGLMTQLDLYKVSEANAWRRVESLTETQNNGVAIQIGMTQYAAQASAEIEELQWELATARELLNRT